MSSDDARRRVEYQAVGGALAQLDTKNPQAAQLLAGVVKAVVVEAERSARFATALTSVVGALAPKADGADAAAPVASVSSMPRKRVAAPRKKVVRQPGAFDPFVVYREVGAAELAKRLGTLDLEQLRDVIAEQELDTRKETSRKRKPEILVEWIVDRVEASENKGSVFR